MERGRASAAAAARGAVVVSDRGAAALGRAAGPGRAGQRGVCPLGSEFAGKEGQRVGAAGASAAGTPDCSSRGRGRGAAAGAFSFPPLPSTP